MDEENRIVVNTSPWIALSICEQTGLLQKLFRKVYMPVAVKQEILAGGELGTGVNELKTSRWIKVEKVSDPDKIKLLYELEQGEAEVIVLAKEKGIRMVLVDKKIARLQAKIQGLEVLGTLGLLLRAKKRGILATIKPLIQKITDGGIWIKEDLVKGILTEAGEN